MNEEELEPTEQPNQPEQPTPPLLTAVAPLDPAPLNALAETVAAKADAAALEPINAALAALGGVPEGAHNLLVHMGEYTGTGTYGSNNKCTLTFPFYPLLVFISPSDGVKQQVCMQRGSLCARYILGNTNEPVLHTWTDNSVTWYSRGSTETHYNVAGMVYRYTVLGYAL